MKLRKVALSASASFAVIGMTAACGGTQPNVPLTPAPTAVTVKGPNPTPAALEQNGPFAFQTQTVAAGNGFGGGTIYYPTATDQGKYAAIAISPGFTENQSAISWLGPRLSSHGFVVITIDTNTGGDNPTSRAGQLRSALHWLTSASSVAGRIDPGRRGVMGHSMGGGGTLEAVAADKGLKAAVPLAPWDTIKDFSSVTTPTAIVGCQTDFIAGVADHAEPFYQSIPGTTDKAYLEMANQGHFCTNSATPQVSRLAVAWMKRFLDDDTRYNAILCPPPTAGGAISEYRANCPY